MRQDDDEKDVLASIILSRNLVGLSLFKLTGEISQYSVLLRGDLQQLDRCWRVLKKVSTGTTKEERRIRK